MIPGRELACLAGHDEVRWRSTGGDRCWMCGAVGADPPPAVRPSRQVR